MPQNKYEKISQEQKPGLNAEATKKIVQEEVPAELELPSTKEVPVADKPEEITEETLTESELPSIKEVPVKEEMPVNKPEIITEETPLKEAIEKEEMVENGEKKPDKGEAVAEKKETSAQEQVLGEIKDEIGELAKAIDKNPHVNTRPWVKKIAIAFLLMTGGTTLTTAMDGYLAKAQEGTGDNEKATVQTDTRNYADEAFSDIKKIFTGSEAEAGSRNNGNALQKSWEKSLAKSMERMMDAQTKGAARSMERNAERGFSRTGMTVKEEDEARKDAERRRKEQLKYYQGERGGHQRDSGAYYKQEVKEAQAIQKQRVAALKDYQQDLKKAKNSREMEMAELRYQKMLQAIDSMDQITNQGR
jgi:hypothetical protein